MDETPGSLFFHYTTREAAFEHILPTRSLAFSPYSRMRDPLENRRWGFVGSMRGDSGPEHEQAWFSFHRHANEIRDSAKLLSLAVDADCENDDGDDAELFARGWSRARMWEQYAENHAGVCLVFSKDPLIKAVTASLSSNGLAEPYNRPVEYSSSAFRPLLDLTELSRDAEPAAVRRWVEDNHDPLFFHKTPDWRTEYEYRFVVTAPGAERVFADFGDALVAVILGERFPRWQRAGAMELSVQAGARLHCMEWWSGVPRPVVLRETPGTI